MLLKIALTFFFFNVSAMVTLHHFIFTLLRKVKVMLIKIVL